ncbi:MAG: hypothetical protein Q9165_007828 [Trypethelium subeluteriae]
MTEATQDPLEAAAHGASEAQAGQDGGGEEDKKKAKTHVSPAEDGKTKSARKRRKVNHEQVKKGKTEGEQSPTVDSTSPNADVSSGDGSTNAFESRPNPPDGGLNLGPGPVTQGKGPNTATILQPTPVTTAQAPPIVANNQVYPGYNNWGFGTQNHFQDIHSLNPSYMFNTSETTDEYNLLNNFLSASLLDEGAPLYSGENVQNLFSDPTLASSAMTTTSGSQPGPDAMQSSNAQASNAQPNQPPPPSTAAGSAIPRPQSSFPSDKARETYYMTAADPTGTDTPEERMNKLLKAKYDAGMLKPFNYVKGYARLNQYMERNLQPASRQKILRQLDRFRPKFRERMQTLTDIELVYVEMWFERSLMEYDRVFASMAIPACCWRRTGEIFRGNKEMAELIHVPMVKLRDGKVAIHEIMSEDALVNYWDKFGAIAFDSSQKAILTRCSLKNPNVSSKDPEIPSFAANITGRVESPQPDAALISELEKHVHHTFSALGVGVGDAKSAEVDSRGTKIWNLSTRLRRDDNSSETRKLCVLLRVFAVLMIDAAQQGSHSTLQSSVRSLKVSLKAARTCLDNEDTVLCLKVLEKAAHYESELGKPENQPNAEDSTTYKKLSGEYFVMRTALAIGQAWKQSRLDLAEHMFEKTARLQRHADPETAERLADVLYEMGKDLLGKKQIELAVRWLERAYDILAEQDLERLSSDAGELRLCIMQSLARAFLLLKTAEARDKAQDLVRIMENDFGHKLVVSMLKLELLSGGGEPDAEVYSAVLLSIVRTVVLTEASFKTILHHIHKLKDVNVTIACKTLDEFLEFRLYDEGRQDWIEKAVVVRIWLTTVETNSTSSATPAHAFLQNVFGNLSKHFTEPAAHAVMTLLWKRIEAAFSQSQYEIAEQWCNIAHHQIFQNSGDVNLAIIARKGIQCALARHDEAAARKMFFQMPSATRAAPQTRYLMYKVAMRGNDMELASECLEIVSRSTNKDATLLYACVLEAQQNGNRQQAIMALQQTLAKLEYTVEHDVHVPALLRCTARLILAEFTSAKVIDDRLVSDLCSLFEGASSQAKRPGARQTAQSNADFTKVELEWFSKNAYNFALKHCTDLHPRTLLRLLQSCTELLELLRGDEGPRGCQDVLLRLSFCHFLAAFASITLARAEDQIEQSAQQYLIARNDAAQFCELFAEVSQDTVGEEAYEDLQAKRFELLRLQLECAVRLGSWNELDELLDECVKQDRIQRLEKLADLVFSVHSALVKSDEGSRHQSKLLATIQKIVRLSWRTAGRDIVKVSRWLRCLFAMALGFDPKVSLVCLDEAKQLVRQGVEGVGGDEPYPAEEIEWLASMAFNRSVDCFCASDDDGCRLWAEKALGLAKASKETGSLYTTLQTRPSVALLERPPLSPGRRSSHPPHRDQASALPSKPVRKDEPFDPQELTRRLEQARLEVNNNKARRLKRSSLCIGNNGQRSIPLDNFIPPVPELESETRYETAKTSLEHRDVDVPIRPQTAAPASSGSHPSFQVSSPKFKPNSSISAFLATTSPRSFHVQPHTMVFEELHSAPQHPNPYYPGLTHIERDEIAIEEMDEVQDVVDVPLARPPLEYKDRPDWTQRSQCGDDFQNTHTLPRFRSKHDMMDEMRAQSISRRTQSVRAPPGATRPDLKVKPRSASHGDALAQSPTEIKEDRRSSHVEPQSVRRKKSTRWTDVVATRQDGVTAAERHREWLEQLREQERIAALARERREREQEMQDAQKKAKRKKSFRWTLLDKVREVVHAS